MASRDRKLTSLPGWHIRASTATQPQSTQTQEPMASREQRSCGAERRRSRSPLRLTSLPASIENRIPKDAALMIVHEDFEKTASLERAVTDRSDLVQGIRLPRASDAPVTDEEHNTWQSHSLDVKRRLQDLGFRMRYMQRNMHPNLNARG